MRSFASSFVSSFESSFCEFFSSWFVRSFVSSFVSSFVRSLVSSFVSSFASSFPSFFCELFCEIVCKFCCDFFCEFDREFFFEFLCSPPTTSYHACVAVWIQSVLRGIRFACQNNIILETGGKTIRKAYLKKICHLLHAYFSVVFKEEKSPSTVRLPP